MRTETGHAWSRQPLARCQKLLTGFKEFRLRIDSRRLPLSRAGRAVVRRENWQGGACQATSLIAANARFTGVRSRFYLNNPASQAKGAPRLQAPARKSCTYIRRRAHLTFHAMEGHRLTGGRLISLEMEVTFQKSFRIASAFHPWRPCCGFLPIHLRRSTCSFPI